MNNFKKNYNNKLVFQMKEQHFFNLKNNIKFKITLIWSLLIILIMIYFCQKFKYYQIYLKSTRNIDLMLLKDHFLWKCIVNNQKLEKQIFLFTLSNLKIQIMNLIKICLTISNFKKLLIQILINIIKKSNHQIMIQKLFIYLIIKF